MTVLSKKLLVVVLVCLSVSGIFAETKESSPSVDQSVKSAKDKAPNYRQDNEEMAKEVIQKIMDACQRNIDAVMVLTERSDLDHTTNSARWRMLIELLNRTQNLLQFSDHSKMIV